MKTFSPRRRVQSAEAVPLPTLSAPEYLAFVGAEIGLLTPPLGISCFVIKSTLDDPSVSLADIFTGAFPFAVIMLAVLVLIIAYPGLSLALI